MTENKLYTLRYENETETVEATSLEEAIAKFAAGFPCAIYEKNIRVEWVETPKGEEV
jgi:hypothetical protein